MSSDRDETQLSEEQQRTQLRRYDELQRHLLNNPYYIPSHLFLYVLQGEIPSRFPIACLLARHPATPETVLLHILNVSPDPECEYPYCSYSLEDRINCRHPIPMDKKIFLYLNLLERETLSPLLLDKASRLSQEIPERMRTDILQRIVGRVETSTDTLAYCAQHPDSDYAVLSLIMIHPNSSEEDRILAALRLPSLTRTEKERAEKLQEDLLAFYQTRKGTASPTEKSM